MNEEELAAIHNQALQNFDKSHDESEEQRRLCLEDRRFYSIAGAQWDGDLGKFFEEKPKIEVNKCHLSVLRIFNEYRNNRITVDFKSKTQDDTLANSLDSLYRMDENDSNGQEGYDNAFEEGVGGGFGAIRLKAVYEDEYDEENEFQRIAIDPVFDADSTVFFDNNAKRYNKSDAKWALLLKKYTKDAYKEEFGEEAPVGWNKQDYDIEFDWVAKDFLYVAEYFRCEEKTETIYYYRNEALDEEIKVKGDDHDDNKILELQATGFIKERERKVKTKKIRKFILSGAKVLEDCGYIPGSRIPIAPFYGKRWYIDGIERYMGHVRLAKDAQRLKNIQLSRLAETASVSPISKPILAPEQIQGFETEWQNSHIKNTAYLRLNPLKDLQGNVISAGPQAYTQPPNIQPAVAALMQVTEGDMKEILGDTGQGEKVVSNIAEETVQLIQNRIDMQSYIYMDNFAKTMKCIGEIWLSMAQELYVERNRVMMTMSADGEQGFIELAKPYNDEGFVKYKNDIKNAKYSVNASVGAATSTKRQSTVKNLINVLGITQDPSTRSILEAMIMVNMEGEGVDEIRDYFRQQLLRQGAVKPTEEEAQKLAEEAANQKPTAEQDFLRTEARKNEVEILETMKNIEVKEADIGKKKAETMETLSDIEIGQQDQLLNMVEKLEKTLEPAVTATTATTVKTGEIE